MSRANGLSDDEAEWLWQLANTPRVADPALVFVLPSLLDPVVESGGERTEAVRRKLFGG